MTRLRSPLALVVALGLVATLAPRAPAWELETDVGLTDRAALASKLDAWLRARGLGEGFYETLGLNRRAASTRALDDHAILDELDRVDAALGVTPDGARQPALSWLLAGTVLEGASMDRVRNHFLDPRTGGGLAEAGTGSARARLEAMRDGSGSVRGIFTGSNFDGTGMRADLWLDAPENELSRTRFLDELERAASAETENARHAALARALLCAGAITHVLEAVGDPAHARGDFTVNYTEAGAPLERWAVDRYGLEVPPPAPASRLPPVPVKLARFITAPDGSGLGDLVGRSFVSPGTLPGTPGELALPVLQPGPGAEGVVAGPLVRTLAGYRRDGDGVRFFLTPASLAETGELLLPRIERRAAQLLDFLFREVITISVDDNGAFHVDVGAVRLERGRVALFVEQPDGRRIAVLDRTTQGGAAHAPLLSVTAAEARSLGGDRRVVALYRGTDGNGEPVVGYAVVEQQR